MSNAEDWKTAATEIQSHYFDSFASRNYDNIEKSDGFCLKKKVGYATCGRTSEEPKLSNYYIGYTKEQIEYINKICQKIIEKSDLNVIKFACTVLVLHSKNEISETPVFRIFTSRGDIFIDAHARVYQDWNDYMLNNKLPDCEYCFPIQGNYYTADQQVGFTVSPASSLFNKTVDCADTAGSVIAIAGASVSAAACVVTVGPVLAGVAAASLVTTGAYCAVRNISCLVDRKKHDQSTGIKDSESRAAWLGIASSALSFGTMAALGRASKIVESGKSVSKLLTGGIRVMNATAVAFSGYGFVESLYGCAKKYNSGVLTKKDVFDLSCELLFLFNALSSAKATNEFVNNISAITEGTPSIQKQLTKSQKRNLRRRMAKKRAKGLLPLSNEPERNSYFSETNTPRFLKMIIQAVKGFNPRIDTISHILQNIGHDIMCYIAKEITIDELIMKLTANVMHLHKICKDEIDSAIKKVVEYFESLNEIMKTFFELLKNSTTKQKSFFTTKVININDEIESLITETEIDINDFQEQLGNESSDQATHDNTEGSENIGVGSTNDYTERTENNGEDSTSGCTQSTENQGDNVSIEDSENVSDPYLSPEVQCLLSKSENIVKRMNCSNLEDYGEVLEGLKCLVVLQLKEKVSNYKKHLETFKRLTKEFDINIYHEQLGIKGDATQHFYEETIKELSSDRLIYKLKNKCQELKGEREKLETLGTCISSTPVWRVVKEGIYLYNGSFGAKHVPKKDMLDVVSKIINKELNDKNCTWHDSSDIILIEVNGQPNEAGTEIVISRQLDEENTAFGLIINYAEKEDP